MSEAAEKIAVVVIVALAVAAGNLISVSVDELLKANCIGVTIYRAECLADREPIDLTVPMDFDDARRE